jgi:hypothetical protein
MAHLADAVNDVIGGFNCVRGLAIAAEASTPLTFMKARRSTEGLSHFFSLSLFIIN